MKHIDKTILALNEYKNNPFGFVISVILQTLIFSIVFCLFSFAPKLDLIISEYLSPLYPAGYCFLLEGYDESSRDILEKMEFEKIEFYPEGNGYAVKSDLNKIWIYKIISVINGRDIWNRDLDELVETILFIQISFVGIGIIMVVIMVNNISNFISFVITQRKNYIQMLSCLGTPRSSILKIFHFVFLAVILLSLVISAVAAGIVIEILNGYFTNEFGNVSSISLNAVAILALGLFVSFMAVKAINSRIKEYVC